MGLAHSDPVRSRPARAGRFRKVLAALLALALLALPAAPSAACGAGGDRGRRAALHHGPDHAAAASASHGPEHPEVGHPAPASAAACCVALPCATLLGDLPAAPAHPSPTAGSSVRAPAAAQQPDGFDAPPDPPPPRSGV